MSFIAVPFGYMLNFLYEIVQDYGLSIVLFTILTKILFYPLQLKSKKSMREVQKLQPKLQQLQKQYANNKQKQQEEVAKLYQEEQVNPMGGCLPLLITLPIMIGLYTVIRQPLTYMLGLTGEEILQIAQSISVPALAGLELTESVVLQYQSQIAGAINSTNLSALQAISPNIVSLNMTFFGIDLSTIPQQVGLFALTTLVPVISGLTSFLAMQVSMKLSGNSDALKEAGGSMKMMQYLSPCMSIWFGWILPTGLGVYWITGNICMIAQEFIMSKQLNKIDLKNKDLEDEKTARDKRNREKEMELKKEEQRRIAQENANKKG